MLKKRKRPMRKRQPECLQRIRLAGRGRIPVVRVSGWNGRRITKAG